MRTALAAAAAAGLGVAADAATPSFDVWSLLLNSSIAGVVVVLLIAGKLVPGKAHDSVVTERDRLQDELRVRNTEDRDRLVPAMVRNTEALTRVIEVLGDRGDRR